MSVDLSKILKVARSARYQDKAWRNIYTCDPSQHLFDDLVSTEVADRLNELVEKSRPIPQRRATTGPSRPFTYLPEEVPLVSWPPYPWTKGRWGEGEEYGVWYGSLSEVTSLREVFYHLRKSAEEKLKQYPKTEQIAFHRALYLASIRASSLSDLRTCYEEFGEALNSEDYAACNAIGRHFWARGSQGILSKSVRDPEGDNLSLFDRGAIVSDQRMRVVRFCFYLDGSFQITHREDITESIVRLHSGKPFS